MRSRIAQGSSSATLTSCIVRLCRTAIKRRRSARSKCMDDSTQGLAFSIVMVVNMEIGLVHPPVGLNLFVTSAVTGLSLGQSIRAALPWLMILLAFLILVTYVPFISLALPHWLGMP
ncbi:TRAP transporter large permease subunit [Pseudomonas asplenii]|uniref:TRAP transporter large permease subunit n=1 Tax=Pseudomonas asplenii TaxID=53407 RepID=UPI0022B6B40D|nr:TRAP transporter large permease subunit [Pseudomonas fuscovaginae]